MAKRPNDRHKPRKSDRGGRSENGRRDRQRKTITSVPHGQLPKWVRDEIVRSTPKDRREPALLHLSKGMEHFANERYPAAATELGKAKKLSPRSSTIRELLGLAAYRSGGWEEALRELRTYRRLTGDLVHMPVEMDSLRALGRAEDVTKTWDRMQEHDLSPTVDNEARVVYASFLLDEGKPRDAWAVIKPGRLIASPSPGELRRWFVAARVALAAGDKDAARKLVSALDDHEPDFEGVDQLRSQLV